MTFSDSESWPWHFDEKKKNPLRVRLILFVFLVPRLSDSIVTRRECDMMSIERWLTNYEHCWKQFRFFSSLVINKYRLQYAYGLQRYCQNMYLFTPICRPICSQAKNVRKTPSIILFSIKYNSFFSNRLYNIIFSSNSLEIVLIVFIDFNCQIISISAVILE